MTTTLAFSPILPFAGMALTVLLGFFAAGLAIWLKGKGLAFRLLAIGLFVLALFNPEIRREDRDPLTSVVAVVVDETSSQRAAGRDGQTGDIAEAIEQSLDVVENIETRTIRVSDLQGQSDGTTLFTTLSEELSDVPPDRIAGAVIVSDGIIHDIPTAEGLGFDAPLHALITGNENEVDRRIDITEAPRFGLVGQEQIVSFRVIDERADDPDGSGSAQPVTVRVSRGGQLVATETIITGQEISVPIEIPHAGESVVTIDVDPLDGEITELNNRAVLAIEGIRENLRVLLVSGEPHSGERTWRNLLKSDASVDLVHFTILRPPEKQDGTPINELSLIAFPTRELFSERIDDFDLIIFDRYQRRGVLPLAYFENIAQYVRNGGAVLVAAGPDFASSRSLFRTPILSILPAEPTGRIVEQPFHAALSELGERHTVTTALPGSQSEPPQWGRWFRIIEAVQTGGTAVMTGPDERPLLIVDRVEEGRVALMLSDHAWLWARGLEGGGPHIPLLRRLSHWLMKEPDLEEDRLTIEQSGDGLAVIRRSMGTDIPPAILTAPDGEEITLEMNERSPGEYVAIFEGRGPGLYRAVNGDKTALSNIGPLNPREYETMVSTANLLNPLMDDVRGSIRRVASEGIPRIVQQRAGATTVSGGNWIGIDRPDAFVVRGIQSFPLISGLLGLALLLGIVGTAWFREGR